VCLVRACWFPWWMESRCSVNFKASCSPSSTVPAGARYTFRYLENSRVWKTAGGTAVFPGRLLLRRWLGGSSAGFGWCQFDTTGYVLGPFVVVVNLHTTSGIH